MQELCECLNDDTLFLAIAEEALVEGSDELLQCLSKQAPWSDLPIILLAADQGRHNVNAPRWRLFEALGNVTILERPMTTQVLRSAARAVARARSRQQEARGFLRELEQSRSSLEARIAERTLALQNEMEHRVQAEAALAHMQRLDALGQLTGGVAHDFNNLLQVMIGGIALLERHGGDSERRKAVLSAMSQAGERGAKLIQQLLAFARRQPLSSETLDVGARIEALQDLLRGSIRPDLSLHLRIAPQLWPVRADGTQLEVALLNLIVNARDATPPGGEITVSAENVTLHDSSQLEGLRGDFVRISVKDTGAGMDEETQQRAFEPFFTTKHIAHGTGLGLSQVYGFARQSGGGTHLHSAPGSGTSVCMFLPRSSEAVSATAETNSGPRTHDGGRILMIEDEDDVAALTEQMLGELGYDTHRLAVAAEALEMDLNNYVAVLSDVITPGQLDGIAVATQLRARAPQLPILLTSGFATSPERLATVDLPLLRKPFTLHQLSDALSGAMSAEKQAMPPSAAG